jgi:hypothetical protein
MTMNNAIRSNVTQKKPDGIHWGLTQFDAALECLIATRNECRFQEACQEDAEVLSTFADRLQIAAEKLHMECNRNKKQLA